MDDSVTCNRCDVQVSWKEYPLHLEEIHVGPRHFEGIKIFCGECSYQVGADKSQLMIKHCIATSHSVQEIQTDWERILRQEDQRLRSLVAAGVEFCVETLSLSQLKSKTDLKEMGRDSLSLGGIEAEIPVKSEQEEADWFNCAQALPKDPGLKKEISMKEIRSEARKIVENRPTRKRKDSSPTLMKCELCPYILGKRPGSKKREGVIHALTHDRGLHPFRCPTCRMVTYHFGSLKTHLNSQKAQESGCDGGYENIQTQEMIVKTRNLLKKAFPLLDWDHLIPPGTSAYGINL